MPRITFETDTDNEENKHVLSDGVRRGYLTKVLHGPGYFLTLMDENGKPKVWKNAAPGARIQQEKDFRGTKTYCKTLSVAKTRTLENL